MHSPFNENNCVVAQQPEQDRWLVFRNPVEILQTTKENKVIDVLTDVQSRVSQNKWYAAGYVNYEAAAGLDPHLPVKPAPEVPKIWFGLYETFEVIKLDELEAQESKPDLEWELLLKESDYREQIGKIKDYIKAGDTYQVNYTFRHKSDFCIDEESDYWSLFVHMVKAQNLNNQPGYCVFVNTQDWVICSASPELFFSYDQRTLKSKPMKGTAPRGYGYQDDLAAGKALRSSKKNCAENIMIADMVRNDLGKIADIGSVETTEILALEKYPTFWTMTTTVQCQTDPNLADIFSALFPAASITGAPKLRSMEIIDELESLPRYIYTGAAGFVMPNDVGQFNVAIRTVLIDKAKQNAQFGVGGGIVWDSDTEDEFEECHTKARVLAYSQPSFDLIETLKWNPLDGYSYLEEHLTRLHHSSNYFSWNLDLFNIRKELLQAAEGFPEVDQRVRLSVSRSSEVLISNTVYTDLPNPYNVVLAKSSVHSKNIFLYHKTSCRYMYDNAMAERGECDDVILWNEKQELTESCRANLIVEIDDEFFNASCKLRVVGWNWA